jgi:hypothetical protein
MAPVAASPTPAGGNQDEPHAMAASVRQTMIAASERPANFAAALTMIEDRGLFTSSLLRKHRSFVMVVARAAQKVDRAPDLTILPCEPRLLRKALESFHPARARIKTTQWQSILSGLRRILRLTGWLGRVSNSFVRTAAWENVLKDITNEIHHACISRFANFPTSIGIDPTGVDHGIFDRYCEWLNEQSLTSNHKNVSISALQTWRRLCRLHKQWGIAPLPKEKRYNLVTTRKGELPASFHSSVDDYLNRCAKPDPFDSSIIRAIAPETLRKRRTYIYLGAQYLLEKGWEADRINHLRSILRPEAIEIILTEQFRRYSADDKIWPPGAKPFASHLKTMAIQVGELNGGDLAKMNKLVGRVRKPKPGFQRKTRERLAVFDDERVLRDFYKLPQALWQEAKELEKSGTGKPLQVRAKAKNAIALAILLVKPLRVGDLASLDFREDFQRDRKGRITGLNISGERTKTGVRIEAVIEGTLGRRIAEYFEQFARPRADHESFLFPRMGVGHVSGAELGQGLAREVERCLGIKFNSHLVRALIATIILDADPNAATVAQRMLDHMHVDTTIHHYGMQRGRAAQRQYEVFLGRALRGRSL